MPGRALSEVAVNREGLERDWRLFRNLSEDRSLKREERKWCLQQMRIIMEAIDAHEA